MFFHRRSNLSLAHSPPTRLILLAALALSLASATAQVTPAAPAADPTSLTPSPNSKQQPDPAKSQPTSQPKPPPEATPDSKPDPQSTITPELRARLEALVPSRPDLYFELGEEIADIARNPRTLELARHLHVLAFSLDRARGGQQLSAQACIAIAQLNENEKDRRWLLSLADLLDRRHARPEWIRRADEAVSSQIAYNAATVLGLIRAGEGYIARQRLAQPGITQLLTAYQRLLSASGDTGAMRWIEREASRWPCPECHNQRIVKKGGGKDAIVKLCTTCGGNPGPKLNNVALVAQLRFESRLLNGIQRSWAAQAWSDQGAPLRDPDPEELPKQFGVDPDRPIWRDGSWVAVPIAVIPKPGLVAPPTPDDLAPLAEPSGKQ